MRRATAIALVLVGSCGGATEEELTTAAEPLIEAHEALEDFQFKIDGGISRGGFADEWPAVSAQVRRNIDDYLDDPPDLDGVDLEEMNAYAEAIATTNDAYGTTLEDLRAFFADEGTEEAFGLSLLMAGVSLEGLDSLREAALTPGPAPTTTTEADE